MSTDGYAEEYLIRRPDGIDYDHVPSLKRAKLIANSLGRGATVHPLKTGSMEVMTTTRGREITSYTA